MGSRREVSNESVSLPATFEVPEGYIGRDSQVTGHVGTCPNRGPSDC